MRSHGEGSLSATTQVKVLSFAGAWEGINEDDFNDFLIDVYQRRNKYFSDRSKRGNTAVKRGNAAVKRGNIIMKEWKCCHEKRKYCREKRKYYHERMEMLP